MIMMLVWLLRNAALGCFSFTTTVESSEALTSAMAAR